MQKTYKFLLLICLAHFSVLPAYAQKTKKKKAESDDVTVIINDGKIEEREAGRKHPYIVKISPSAWAMGNFPIDFEYQLNGVFSIQGGIGVSFQGILPRQYSSAFYFDRDLGLDDFGNSSYESNWATPAFVSKSFLFSNDEDKTIKQKLGYIFNLSPRFYISRYALENYYLSPSVTFSKVRFDTPKVIENNMDGYDFDYSTSEFFEEKDSRMSITLRGGYQYVSDSNITFDTFVGLGARFSNITKLDIGTNSPNSVYKNGSVDIKRKTLLFELGFRIGYLFQ